MRKTIVFLFLGLMLLVFHTFLVANTKDLKFEKLEKIELLDNEKVNKVLDGEVFF